MTQFMRQTFLVSIAMLCLPASYGSDTPDIGLLAEVEVFLSTHTQFGRPIGAQEVPDWFEGKRQRVRFASGRSLLFYTKDGQVVTVYEDRPGGGRVKIWGEHANLATDPGSLGLRSGGVELPDYEIIFATKAMSGGGNLGDILVPTLSPHTSSAERESVARQIAKKENISQLTLYSTREAYEANISESYAKSNPGVLRNGLLGVLREDKWTSAEEILR